MSGKRLAKMISIVADAFKDKTDRGGNPYILHCLYVMYQVQHLDYATQIAAVGHDLIEDTDWTAERLREEGFSEEEIGLIVTLTHDPVEPYDVYIKRVAMNPKTKAIKRGDLRHNSDITRMKGVRQKDFDRLEKYHRAYMYLSD